MKRILLISVLLAFVTVARGVNAMTVENVVISDTGGEVSVSGEAHATGSSDADADVRSVIRTEGSNTRVRIDVSAAADGEGAATSSELQMTGLRNQSYEVRTVGAGRFEVRVAPESDDVAASESEVTASSTDASASGIFSVWANLKASFMGLYHFVFFWER